VQRTPLGAEEQLLQQDDRCLDDDGAASGDGGVEQRGDVDQSTVQCQQQSASSADDWVEG
jgi:hypothetical protein